MLNQYFKHKKNHSYIKGEVFRTVYYSGIGFNRNPVTNAVAIEENTIFNPSDWQEVSREEFVNELKKVIREILARI